MGEKEEERNPPLPPSGKNIQKQVRKFKDKVHYNYF